MPTLAGFGRIAGDRTSDCDWRSETLHRIDSRRLGNHQVAADGQDDRQVEFFLLSVNRVAG